VNDVKKSNDELCIKPKLKFTLITKIVIVLVVWVISIATVIGSMEYLLKEKTLVKETYKWYNFRAYNEVFKHCGDQVNVTIESDIYITESTGNKYKQRIEYILPKGTYKGPQIVNRYYDGVYPNGIILVDDINVYYPDGDDWCEIKVSYKEIL